MMQFFDRVLAFVRAVNSSVDERTQATKITTDGIPSFSFDGTTATVNTEEGEGELADDQAMFGGLGFLSRPLDPETLGDRRYAAEAVAARTADGLVPMSWRDLRFERFFPSGLPKGAVRMVGYGGGMSSLDVRAGTSGEARENVHTVYIPFAYVNGTPTKAHALVIDPSNGISITHADGYQLGMNESGITMRTSDAETFVNVTEGEVTITSKKIMLKGNVYVGQSAELGIPLLPGVASPPCPSLFVSPQ